MRGLLAHVNKETEAEPCFMFRKNLLLFWLSKQEEEAVRGVKCCGVDRGWLDSGPQCLDDVMKRKLPLIKRRKS